MGKPIKVMIVDDSAVVRQVLQQKLASDPAIEVIAVASDPLFAMTHLAKARPDVIVLDVEMPRMDGITFLRKLMAETPLPVVICSTLTEKGAKTTLEALSAGAVSIVTKPKVGLKDFLQSAADDITAAVKAAARANVRNLKQSAGPALAAGSAPVEARAMAQTTDRVIAIGTSTGGTQALEAIFRALPANAPGIVVVQHMPEKFTGMFAERLNQVCAIRVKEAEGGDRVIAGQALIAPGGRHLRLKRSGAQYRVEVFDGPLVNRHKPSVDVLFRSVAQCAGSNAVGFILTGMGDDGARGLLEMREAGAVTYAQDERSCVVFGMPKEAIQRGAAQHVVPLATVPKVIMSYGG